MKYINNTIIFLKRFFIQTYLNRNIKINWTCNSIWFDELKNGEVRHLSYENSHRLKGEYLNHDYQTVRQVTDIPVSANYLIIEDFKSKNGFSDIKDIKANAYLEFNRANIISFFAISMLGPIKRLELNRCIKLTSDNGLSDLAPSLQWLAVNTSKKFTPSDSLFSLRNLRVLCLNDCGDIENLEFLKNFPNLLEFRFVNTKVISGNLEPLLSHESLLDASFLDMNHYSHSFMDLRNHFDRKNQNTVDYLHKKSFSTYRYKDKYWM